jgi:hypothetical protein
VGSGSISCMDETKSCPPKKRAAATRATRTTERPIQYQSRVSLSDKSIRACSNFLLASDNSMFFLCSSSSRMT